ncbi:hypothetical protein CkaCkLH20_10470 [Colletotrichum karsti]|uniref:Uncharacterized protein n=1 Tax=Colletotrichum karsti TaxID=1095194 RepID=A0A9P6HWI3_9PEZI|nr:uncharacterized protein CkaCkLH20_10470 [Colletotrichum karsti]KAF9872133.1 hypothetical protein CkaCkLH20_10470 [Colletotrichum karsti]
MSSSGSGGGKQEKEEYRSGGYTKNDSFAWGSKGKGPTYIDKDGWKRNTCDGNRTYENPPRKYNPDARFAERVLGTLRLPLKVTETIAAELVRQASTGQWIFNLATNVAGTIALSIKDHGAQTSERITF